MRRLLVVLCLCACGAFPARVAAQLRAPGSNQPLHAFEIVEDGRIRRLEEWLKTLARHAPGEEDAALAEAAAWPNADLKTLWLDANALVQIIRLPPDRRPSRFAVRSEGQKNSVQIRYSPIQFKRLVELACAAGGLLREPSCIKVNAAAELDRIRASSGDRTRESTRRRHHILRHGAILHGGDVAMLAPAAMVAPGSRRPTAGRALSDGDPTAAKSIPQSASTGRSGACCLTSSTRAADAGSGHDEMVVMVARGVGCSCARITQLHLDRARATLPADPTSYPERRQHETYAGVPIQIAVRLAILPAEDTDVGRSGGAARGGRSPGACSRSNRLREARPRHGRVLGGSAGTPKRRWSRRAVAGPDRQLRLAELFLGGEGEALGNRRAGLDQQAADRRWRSRRCWRSANWRAARGS